jgi:predicted nucleic acid-binding Zn ribbon protein
MSVPMRAVRPQTGVVRVRDIAPAAGFDPARPSAEVDCGRCGAALPSDAAYCSECGAQRTADRQPGRRRWAWGLMAAAILLLAVGVGAAVGMLTRSSSTPGVAEQPTPTATPVPTGTDAGPIPSVAPPPTEVPTATPAPTPVSNPILSNRAIADVLVDKLNVREAGNQNSPVLGQLGVDARVFVIGAPDIVGEMYWYRIAVVSGPYSAAPEFACAGYSPCALGLGHVASPVEGDPWLAEARIDCPASPMSADALAALLPLEQLHCYESREIVVSGTLNTPCCSYFGPVQFDPSWLARPDGPAYFMVGDSGQSLWFRVDPAGGLDVPARGDVVRATGHFDHEASSSCRASPDPDIGAEGFNPERDVPSVASVVVECRARLVVTEYEIVDHEDLGPCCGMRDDRLAAGRGHVPAPPPSHREPSMGSFS